jgi:hypothetical protein
MPNASAYNPDPMQIQKEKKKSKKVKNCNPSAHMKGRIEKSTTQRRRVGKGSNAPAMMPSMYPISEYRPSSPQSAAQPEMVDTVKT